MGAKFQIKYLYNILTPSLMKLPFTSFFIYIIFIACRPSMKLEETDTDFDFEKIKVSMGFIDELSIGISFFTFQAISYVIDVYRGRGEVQNNPINVGLYISFFP